MPRRVEQLALIGLLVVCCTSLRGCDVEPEVPSTTNVTVPCQEDEPCWDWRTMGNRCGRDSLNEPIRCY